VIFLLGALALGAGLWLGWALGARRRWRALALIVLAVTLAFAAVLWSLPAADTRSGFDGVAEVALALLIAAPLELGLLIGAGVAAWRNRHRS
jgi:hypothetical protein